MESARRAYARSSWAEVIRLLEPMVVHNRDSFQFYRLLGLACLRSGDIAGAGTYLRRAAQLSPHSEEMALALAALDLRKRDLPSAVEAYLEVIERHPASHIARKALEFLRRNGDDDSLNELVDSGRIAAFYPGKPRRSPLVRISIVFLSAVLIGLFAYFQKNPIHRQGPRKDIEAIQLSGRELESPIQSAGSQMFILTEKQAIDSFEHCKRLFQAYRDNEAIKEANRILLSNASVHFKEKARQLKGLAQVPTFRNVKDNPSFKDVMASPASRALHDGCAVIWKGRLANVASAEQMTRFDFLVGYQDFKTLDGMIPVVWSETITVLENSPVEILAIVRVQADSVILEGVSFHDLSYGTEK